MPNIDDLLGIAALATLGWTAALIAQPTLTAGVATLASGTPTAVAAVADCSDTRGAARVSATEPGRRT